MIKSNIYIYFILFSLLILFSVSCEKTEPSSFQSENYQKFFGGSYENTSVDMFVLNNEYYIAGDFTQDDKETTGILVVKTDDYGNRIWERKISKTNNLKVADISPLHDNSGLAIIGTYETDDSLYYNDFFLQILNLDGDTIFNKIYNLPKDELGKCIGQYSDGTFILVGVYSEFESSEVYKYALSISESGELLRTSKLKDGRPPQEVYSMTYDSKNNFYIVGGKFPGFIGTKASAGIFAVNSSASFTNHFTYNIDGAITDLVFENDTSVIVCGVKNSDLTSKKSQFVASINPYIDDVNWMLDYTEDRKPNYIVNDIILTENSQIMTVGSKEDISGNYNIFITYSLLGKKLSEKEYGGLNNDYGIRGVDINGKPIVLGTSERDGNSLLTLFRP